MMKNKQLVWSGVALLVVVLAASSVWLWHVHTNKVDAKNLYESQSAYRMVANKDSAQPTEQTTDASQGTATQASGGAQIVSQQPTPNTGASQPVSTPAATNSTSSAIAKLLDPSTFGQYDKYKNATSASYIDLQQGTGATLQAGQKAAVYYRGWLTNGTLFDQSQKGVDGVLQAFGLQLGAHQVIAGWEEGLVGMKVGGVRLLIVPPSVGYGNAAQGPIPADSVLVFQVQLAGVQ